MATKKFMSLERLEEYDALIKEKIDNDIESHTHNYTGRNVEGQTFNVTNPTTNTSSDITAAVGAEIFNNYDANKATGAYSHAEGVSTTAYGMYSHAEGSGTRAVGESSHAEGSGTGATGNYSHSEGGGTTASGMYSHAEGSGTRAVGNATHAEGGGTTASGMYSHAEGSGTKASGDYSHAEGYITEASGENSHAEGDHSQATNKNAHAEGSETVASGVNSHAEGVGTLASSPNQHVQGRYNINDTGNMYAHIVGNGTDSSRSNAHTLDWSGNAWFKGNIKVGGSSYSNASELALKSDLDNIDLSGLETKTDAQAKLDEAKAYTDAMTSGIATSGVVDNKISAHNSSATAHTDIRDLITELSTKVDNFLDVDDTTTDQLSEVLTLINNNKGTLDSLTSSKVNVSDIVDNLTTSNASKVLSAKQGVALKGLIDALQEVVDGKADEEHTHAISDVTNLQSALNAKASQTDLDTHVADTTKHITSTERTNWNTAKSHADSAHAPSNAQENIIESIKVNGTAQTVTSKSVNITVPTDAADIGAAPATHGHAISDITDLQTTLNNAASAIGANTSSIEAHNDRISALETKVGDGFEEITSQEIQNLFK